MLTERQYIYCHTSNRNMNKNWTRSDLDQLWTTEWTVKNSETITLSNRCGQLSSGFPPNVEQIKKKNSIKYPHCSTLIWCCRSLGGDLILMLHIHQDLFTKSVSTLSQFSFTNFSNPPFGIYFHFQVPNNVKRNKMSNSQRRRFFGNSACCQLHNTIMWYIFNSLGFRQLIEPLWQTSEC